MGKASFLICLVLVWLSVSISISQQPKLPVVETRILNTKLLPATAAGNRPIPTSNARIHTTDSNSAPEYCERRHHFNWKIDLLSGAGVAEQPISHPNVVLVCVDDLRPELNCYGSSYVHSPNIDGLAKEGRLFSRHFVQAPTCGASRFAMLTGRYGSGGNAALFQRAKRLKDGKKVTPSMPAWFRQHGYETVSVGKVSHHPGGCGGSNWDERSKLEMPESWGQNILPGGKWKHPRGWMHGLANGQIRGDSKAMDVFQSVEGDDSVYPDGLGTEQALKENKRLAVDDHAPFFLAVGILRPHLPFGAPEKYMKHYNDAKPPAISNPRKPTHRTTWQRSGEFMRLSSSFSVFIPVRSRGSFKTMSRHFLSTSDCSFFGFRTANCHGDPFIH